MAAEGQRKRLQANASKLAQEHILLLAACVNISPNRSHGRRDHQPPQQHMQEPALGWSSIANHSKNLCMVTCLLRHPALLVPHCNGMQLQSSWVITPAGNTLFLMAVASNSTTSWVITPAWNSILLALPTVGQHNQATQCVSPQSTKGVPVFWSTKQKYL